LYRWKGSKGDPARIELQDLPETVMVRFDPRRLRRIFFNLIHNAMNACSPTTPSTRPGT